MTNKEKNTIEYKLVCYYYAKTELYDRMLSEPFIDSPVFSWSCYYADRCYHYIKEIGRKFGIKIKLNEYSINSYSPQHWIDEYNILENNNEYDFMK